MCVPIILCIFLLSILQQIIRKIRSTKTRRKNILLSILQQIIRYICFKHPTPVHKPFNSIVDHHKNNITVSLLIEQDFQFYSRSSRTSSEIPRISLVVLSILQQIINEGKIRVVVDFEKTFNSIVDHLKADDLDVKLKIAKLSILQQIIVYEGVV